MKNTLIILCLLITLCCATSSKAQKAYDITNYKTIIYGNQTTLQLADGYLLASKVTIHSKLGNQVFSPSADEPDARGDLRFDAVKGTGGCKDNKGTWLTLKKIKGSEYPSLIEAIYWNGKVQKAVVFRRAN